MTAPFKKAVFDAFSTADRPGRRQWAKCLAFSKVPSGRRDGASVVAIGISILGETELSWNGIGRNCSTTAG